MNTTTKFAPIPDTLLAKAKAINLIDLAGRYIELKKWSTGEMMGACPKCGGKFHVRADWWKCYGCHPSPSDSVEFLRMVERVDFRRAVEMLTGDALPEAKVKAMATPSKDERDWHWQLPAWQPWALRRVEHDRQALARSNGSDYLMSRGLQPATWTAFNLGYHVHQNGVESISIPWYVGDRLRAIRYRYLQVQDGQKLTAAKGSGFGGAMFGGQHLLRAGERHRRLLIMEGEINLMSAWQVAHDWGVDILCTGSETSTLPDKVVAYASEFKHGLIWLDKPKNTKSVMAQIPGSVGIFSDTSEGKQDANDLLKTGQLGGFLAAQLFMACKTQDDMQSLLWDVWDAAHRQGIDSGAAQVVTKIGEKIGVPVEFVNDGSGRWIPVTRPVVQP